MKLNSFTRLHVIIKQFYCSSLTMVPDFKLLLKHAIGFSVNYGKRFIGITKNRLAQKRCNLREPVKGLPWQYFSFNIGH